MTDLMQTFLGTDNGTNVLDKLNQNFRDRHGWGPVTTITDTSGDADADTEIVYISAASSNATLVLDSAVSWDGKVIRVMAVNVTNTITIDGDGTNINGSGTQTMGVLNELWTLFHNGTTWNAWKQTIV